MKNKLNASELVARLTQLAKEKIAHDKVVSLTEFKSLKDRKKVPTVLVIEDEDSIRKSLQRMFEGCGYRVLVVRDGVELSEVLYDVVVDLIVLDVGLPWLNGFELAQAMKEQEALKTVPLIFISGLDDIDSIKKGFQAGAHDFITKPFDVEKVIKTVQTLLKLNS